MLATPVGWQRLLALAPFPDNVGRSTKTLLALVQSRLRLRVLLMQLGCQRGVNEQLEQREDVLDGRIARPWSGCSSILDVVDSKAIVQGVLRLQLARGGC